MIRNEHFVRGVCVRAEIVDVERQIISMEINGDVVASRPMTADEIEQYLPKPTPLDSAKSKLLALGLTADEVAALTQNPANLADGM